MVQLGIDRIQEEYALFQGKKLGLITGASGLNSQLQTDIDVLQQACDLRVLLAPEHGIRGILGPGELVETHRDALSGLPAYSLFEDTLFAGAAADKDRVYLPPQEALDAVDTLVFDLQDAGSRYFTYASTLFYAMRAAALTGKQMIVLDRPNPIGGEILEGNCHDPALFSFVGLTPVPIRHGMTMGELACYFNGEHQLNCPLHVVKMSGWRREMFYDETGLFFTPPSPNLPTPEAVVVYNGTCLLEGTNVTVGRGTTTPFTLIGAPYIDPVRLADAMNRAGLPGLRFAPAFFRPEWGKHAHTPCAGVRIHVTDEKAVRAVELGIRLICAIRELWPRDFRFTPPPEGGRWHIDLTSGSDELRLGRLCADELVQRWSALAEQWRPIHDRYALY